VNLERFVAVMRPRGSFEAVDFGFLVTRRFWPRLFIAWLVLSLPTMALLAWWQPGQPYLLIPIFWWLKPLFERPMLFVLSRGLFGVEPPWREVFSWRSLGPGLFADLTVRRLSPHRSLTMPVTLLEGGSGATGRARRGLIGSSDVTGAGLTFGCWLAELAFFVSLFFLLDILLPSGFAGFEDFDIETAEVWPSSFGLLCYFFYFLTASLLEPFYVGGGFLLYLQRRTVLEGWDVELAFRRMLQRRGQIEAEKVRRAGAGLAALLLVALGLALAAPVRADVPVADLPDPQNQAADKSSPDAIRQEIGEIAASPDFGGEREVESWHFKSGKPLFEKPDSEVRVPSLPIPWGLLRWVALMLALGVVVYFLIKAWGDRASYAGGGPRQRPAGQRRFGLEEDPLAPIGDVTARARKALEAGRIDEALAWLYRGAFQELAGRGLLPLRRDFTEDDCLRHLRRKAAGRNPAEVAEVLPFEQLFREIADAWMRVAYGHFEVQKAEVARFCIAFDRVYKAAEAEAA
jgi:hypothetical protein